MATVTKPKAGEPRTKFQEAARELGCDESEDRFKEALRKVGRAKPPPDPADTSKPPKKPGQ